LYTNYVDNDNDGMISAGDDVMFTISVYNQGTITADSVSVTDYVPADMIFDATNSSNAIWTGGTATAPSTTITNLAAGASTSVQITLQIDPAFQGTSIINDAEITSASNELGIADEDSTPEVIVGQVFDLALNKMVNTTATPGPYQAGSNVTFNVIVYNQGTLDATNIVVEDYLPSNMTFVSRCKYNIDDNFKCESKCCWYNYE